ncbi:hypothetical protein BKA69DRAFT_1113601 [Paraphysoderma sedebokerense]|nr:hypothetical protein BKA69DRAFT_1113601 [Paraphysoderma sedebokerense]
MPTYTPVPTSDTEHDKMSTSPKSAKTDSSVEDYLALFPPTGSASSPTLSSGNISPDGPKKGTVGKKTNSANDSGLTLTNTSLPSLVIDASSDSAKDAPATPTTEFIKIVGIPLPNPDTTDVDTVVVHSANAPTLPKNSNQPEDLSPTSCQNKLIDIIDAANEDPFTLEPFESLLAAHAAQGKDFILARVTTVDPEDESRLYYSYYGAHHINKVLFRTQPEEGLLHRMKAKNPLNNMTIVGDVHYYIITPDSYFAARKNSSTSAASSPRDRESGLCNSHNLRRKSGTIADRVLEFLNLRSDNGNISPKKMKLHLVMSRPELFIDDGTKSGEGKKHNRRLTADDIYYFVSKSNKTEASDAVFIKPPFRNSPSTETFSSHTITTIEGASSSISDASSSQTATRKEHKRAGSDASTHSGSSWWSSPDWWNGWYFRASGKMYQVEPQSKNDMLTANPKPRHHRVKTSSYVNEKDRFRKEKDLKVEDWIRIHASGIEGNINGEDVSTTDKSNHRRRRTAKKSPSASAANHLPSGTPGSNTKPIIYHAQFYATDDDFLMKSTIRSYFKSNALTADDSILFAIPSSTTVLLPNSDLDPHPALMGLYTIDGENGGGGLLGRRSPRTLRILKWLMLLYIIAGVLLIKFVVPENLTYLFAFLLIFVLCFMLVFVVECEF